MNATNSRPPAAHTHRGKPVDFALQGHHEATKPAHAPTHRAPGPAVVPDNVPPWVRMLQAHADQAERNRDA